MGNTAISVEHLGKRYRIGQAEQRPQNLRETLSAYVRSSVENYSLGVMNIFKIQDEVYIEKFC